MAIGAVLSEEIEWNAGCPPNLPQQFVEQLSFNLEISI